MNCFKSYIPPLIDESGISGKMGRCRDESFGNVNTITTIIATNIKAIVQKIAAHLHVINHCFTATINIWYTLLYE